MALAKGAFVHEEEDDDGDHPMRYLPIRHVYSSSAPCINPSGSSSVMSKKVKARKPSDEECDDEICSGKSPRTAKKPFLVYCRRAKRPRFDSSEGKVEKLSGFFGGAEGNAIDSADGERPILDADSIAGEKIANKRTTMKYELLRLRVGDSALDGSSGPRLRAFQGFKTPKLSLSSKQVHVRDRKNSTASNKMKRWVELDFGGADPDLLIGLACKVYWPMDDEWYKALVSGYNSSTNEHKIDYKDGEVENLVLSKEKIKFHISVKEMQQLNLKCRIPYMEEGFNYNELMSLAVNFYECQDFEPGDLVWAKITGHAMWPAVVLLESEFCSNRGLKPGRAETILVQFFGTHDFARIKFKQAIPFLNGLLSSLHQKCRQARFYQSLDEAKEYLKIQQLPKSMLELQKKIDTHDFRALSDEEVDSGDDASADVMANAFVEMSPIEIGDLRVTSLGKIVCHSDHFHNKKHIWPEGYTAFRKFTSMQDPSRKSSYKMEVLRNPKIKSRPLFRVTPEDGEQIDGTSPNACWKEIFNMIKEKSDGNHAEVEGSDFQKSGSYMFGFSNPQISQLIQELPNSRLCLKYFEKSGDQPTGYRAVRVDWKGLDKCSVCDMDEEYEDNLFLQCDRCRIMVHARCYGDLEPLDGVLWLCNLCRPGAPKFPPICCLCPVIGGAIKPTTDGRWAHLTCAMWIPETCLIDVKRMEPIDGISQINKDRWKLLCSICGVSYGACIQCSHNTCRVAYHPLCARAADLCVELEDEEKNHLMSLNEDDDQCIRLLSFCKKHRRPSSERPPSENNCGLAEQLVSNYVPASNPSGCARSEPYNSTRRRGQRQPHVLAAASVKRLFVENKPYLVSGYRQNGNACGSAMSACSYSLCMPNEQNMREPPVEMLGNISSMAEKYTNMKATFKKRLAFGKSKIHGFGVFAKLAHKAGDMVIEYIGEVVRPTVADIREHRIYNSLVGAGTYMFRIDDERVIDATRAGSIAHLINHSCEPNCYSRVINVNGDAHIIIFAKRDINQWEELTYDYRFFSVDEQLACYCGFPRCRGVVNDTEAEEQSAKIRVPSSELVPWNGQ